MKFVMNHNNINVRDLDKSVKFYQEAFGLTIALAENAAANGVKFQFDSPVTGLSRTGDFWTVETPTMTIQARTVINAAGVHAGDIHGFATGENLKIIPRRGEYFLMDHTV